MTEQLFHHLLPSIEQFSYLGYWLAFFAAFAETALVIGLLVPGSSFLLLLGAVASTGQLDFSALLWFAIAGAVLGDNLNFWLGKRYGQRWKHNGVWFMKPEHFEQAHLFFDRHGAHSIFLGRFIPSIKEIAPFVAGTVGMRRHSFFFWNLLGAIGWGLEWVGGGYLFGQSLTLAQAWMSRLGLAIFLLLLLWLLFYLLKRAVVRHGPQVWLLLTSLFRSIRKNPFIRRWARRHPRATAWLARRVDRRHFQGFPLTLLSLSLLYVLALSAGIIEDFVNADPIIAFDHASAEIIAHFRSAEIIQPFIAITSLGVPQVVAPLLLASMAVLWRLQKQRLIIPLLVSSLGATLFNYLGKLAFHRPRPLQAVLLENTYSFPSGHATIAVAFYGFIGYLLIRSSNSLKTRVNRFFVTLILVLLIALSRIILGVHYVSDVWAGLLLGAIWLIIGISLSEWQSSSGHIDWRAPIARPRKIQALVIVLLALSWLILFNLNWQPARFTPPPQTITDINPPFGRYLQAHHLANSETLLGQAGQPLSLIFLSHDLSQLTQALQAAGWRQADAASYRSMLQLVEQGMNYETAPLAPSFWNNRINDLAFERAVNDGKNRRLQTLRLWRTPWRSDRRRIFVAIARVYDGIQLGLLHHIAPDVDAAAMDVVQSLQKTGAIERVRVEQIHPPMIGKFLLGGAFFSQGKIYILDQKQ